MNIEIVEKKDNALLSRTEVRFKVLHEKGATPKRDEVREKLAGLLNTKKTLVVVDNMASAFGRQETRGYARIYAATDVLGKSERLYLLKRNKLEEHAPKKKVRTEAPAGAAPAAGAKRKK